MPAVGRNEDLDRLGRSEEPDWSGTNVPPPKKREQLRGQAEYAEKLNAHRDEKVTKRVKNLASGECWALDRLLIGQGFAAVLDLATSKQQVQEKARKSPPKVLAIGEGNPWTAYDPKRMGQAPSLLSPQGFIRPPLHFVHPKRDPKSQRFLSSKAFALAVNWNRAMIGLRMLRGTAKEITPLEKKRVNRQGYKNKAFRIKVEPQQGNTEVELVARQVDVVSGPGPPRKLRESKLTEDERSALRDDVRRDGHTWKRLLYAAEPFKSETNLPPFGSRVLIWGGSATSAWVWERFHQYGKLQGGEDPEEDDPSRPYDMWWAARPPSDPKKDPWGAIRIGPRNEEILEHSEKYRSVVPLKDVSPDTEDGDEVVSVEFEGDGPPITTFDQIVVAIGREPTQPGGAVDLMEKLPLEQGLEPIIEPRIEDGPKLPGFDTREIAVGARTPPDENQTGTWVRALGAAGSKVGKSRLLSESDRNEFDTVQGKWLSQLPAEAQVPPGITAAGETIPLANGGLDQSEVKLNINTDVRYDLFVGFKALVRDRDQAREIANEILEYRTPSTRRNLDRYRGFATIDELKELPSVSGTVYQEVKKHLRV